MQPEDELIWHLVKQIVETVFENETPAARLQQVAILLTINALQNHETPLTTQRLGDVFGLGTAQTSRLVLRLVERGLVERQRVHNRQGRGHAYVLRVRETPDIAALRQAISGGNGDS